MTNISAFTNFKKQKKYLICVDSDGCVMNTMDSKHILCFGPCTISHWELEQWKGDILALWNEVNLYTMTRGINRFKGLAIVLTKINQTICAIEDIESLIHWTNTSPTLSNDALAEAISQTNSSCLKKTLAWSKDVNKAIASLPEETKRPFANSPSAVQLMHQYADVAVVSSANFNAIFNEWSMYGLLKYSDILLTQDIGNKEFCIKQLLQKGYEYDCVLMCGDAPGDMEAAQKTGVLFYPVIVKQENECWTEFIEEGLPRFLNGTYTGDYQQNKLNQFLTSMGAK